ncbi:prepilin-type N-terminal cleavage/methylation domain-containing protein [Clostridium chrysemydis]|uniref:prepilin-type N-terminal cleavage/methylation domain-containing protein n=1 Tax=Clostridium chrysemydis TaxID=2665504 RepID=UPI001883C84C|nr:prepilin-type N-terminal cleavage/methylation domain-containing protein [Clostridium chrysemydis]
MNTLKKRKKKGFTLIELIAVVAILAILAAVAVPRVIEYVNKSKRVAVQTTASTIYNAAEAAYNDGTLDAVKGTGAEKEKAFEAANVNTVITELKNDKLLNNVDTSKLGTLANDTMQKLQDVVDADQSRIQVDSQGVYQGLEVATTSKTTPSTNNAGK